MKRQTLSLKARFTIVCVILSMVVSLLFTALIYLSVHTMESVLIGRILNSLGDWYIQLEPQPSNDRIQFAEGITFYKVNKAQYSQATIPDELVNLPTGFSEIVTKGTDYHAFVKEQGEYRYIVSFDQTEFERFEIGIYVFVLVAVLVFVFIGSWTGNLLTNTALKPINELADQMEKSNPEDLTESISHYYSDDVVGQLASTFDKQTSQIRYFLAQEKLFTGDVSHELRTPITVIAGAVDVLKNQSLPTKSLDVVERISNATSAMSKLVNAFLLITRVESESTPRKQSITVNQLVAEQLSKVSENLVAKNIEIEFVEKTILKLELIPELLDIVISNLMRNAEAYLTKGKLHVEIDSKSVIISDTGPGIPASVLDQVFAKGNRLSSEEAKGTGMGLAIVKRICDLNHWDIGISSEEGVGTTYTLQLG